MNTLNKILIADSMHESIIESLTNIGYLVDYQPAITREKLSSELADCIGLVIRSKTFIDADVLARATNLRFIARAGAGVDNVDMEVLEDKGITLLNAPEGNRDALGEHVVGMLLTLLNRIHMADKEVKNKEWKRESNRGHELKNRTIGIFGYGFMGSAVAEKLSGFGCKVLSYDKKKDYHPNFAIEADWETFSKETQILSIHVPLTEETSHLFDKQKLQQFDRLEVVINTARGEILVLSDLVEMLEEKKLIGACLDVLENEKIPSWTTENHALFDRLKRFENVILTPHVGGWTYESYQRISEVLVNKIVASELG